MTAPVPAETTSQPVDHHFRITPLGQTMCRTCGAIVDYIDGRRLHVEWHRGLEGGER